MMICESNVGDIVVVENRGELIAVQVGRVLFDDRGHKGKRKATSSNGVICTRLELDARTFACIPFDERCRYSMGLLRPDVEVIAVIATLDFWRRLVYSRAAAARDAAPARNDVESVIDPIRRMRERAERQLYDDTKYDIPF